MSSSRPAPLVALSMFVGIGFLGACAAMNDLAERSKAAMASFGSSSAGPGGSGAPPAGAVNGPGATQEGQSGGGNSQVWCCVNKAFYDCKTAEKAIKCVGQPFEISPCVQKCPGGDQACTMKCMKDYGPDAQRGPCDRTPARDGECK